MKFITSRYVNYVMEFTRQLPNLLVAYFTQTCFLRDVRGARVEFEGVYVSSGTCGGSDAAGIAASGSGVDLLLPAYGAAVDGGCTSDSSAAVRITVCGTALTGALIPRFFGSEQSALAQGTGVCTQALESDPHQPLRLDQADF